MKKVISLMTAFILLLSLLTSCKKPAVNSDIEQQNKLDVTTGFLTKGQDEFHTIAENGRLLLAANVSNGEIYVQDKENGKTWYSNPVDKEKDSLASGFNKVSLLSQVLVTYTTSTGVVMNVGSFTGAVNRDGLSYRIDGEQIIFKYEFAKENLVVPIRYSITEEAFVAEILTANVEELGDNIISSIDLLPFFGAGGVDDKGYLFVPDGSGALIHFNNGKTSAEGFEMSLFGFDNGVNDRLLDSAAALNTSFTQSENSYLPVFGEKCNEDGFLAIISSGYARATIKGRVAKKYTNYNHVWSSYQYRTVATVRLMQKEMNEKSASIAEKVPDTSVNYEVRYQFLKRGNSDYSAMAKRYQDYLIENYGLTAKTKGGDIPFFLDLYGYIKKTKSFYGIPKDKLIVTTSIKDATNIVEQLKSFGIHNINLKYNYWMKDGYYKTIQTDGKLERKIGSEKELKALNQLLEADGGSLYLGAELLNVYKTGNGVSKYSNVLNSIANTPQMQYKIVLDSAIRDSRYKPWYLVKPSHLPKYFSEFIKNYKKIGIGNVAFDSIGTMAYSELSSDGTSRTQIPDLYSEIMSNALKDLNHIMVSGANSFVAVHATNILNTPSKSSRYDIQDDSIPFYQLVFHGFSNYSLGATNLSSNPQYVALKCLEYGAVPMYSWVARNSEELIGSRTDDIFSPEYEKWIEHAVMEYNKINEVLKDTQTLPMTSHKILAEGVTETIYGNGLRVIVNYNDLDVTIDGKVVGSYDYLVIEEENAVASDYFLVKDRD